MKNNNSKNKRLFVISNDFNKRILDNMLADKAELENATISAEIEQILFNYFLTDDEQKNLFIKTLYYSSENPIGECLSDIFAFNASQFDFSSMYDVSLILRHMTDMESYNPSAKNEITDEVFHLLSNLDSIIQYLKDTYNIKQSVSPFTKDLNEKRILQAEGVLKQAQEDNQRLDIHRSICIFQDNWDALKEFPISYRCLSDLALLRKTWYCYAWSRSNLLTLLKEMKKGGRSGRNFRTHDTNL